MVIDKSFVDGKTVVRCHGIENRALRNMTPDELDDELKRVEREIRLWNQMTHKQPPWFKSVPGIRRQYNCLASEKRRIECELKQRVAALTLGVGWTDTAEVAA